MKFILAAALALLSAPAFADVSNTNADMMECKDFLTADSTDMATIGQQVKGAMSADAMISAMAEPDVTKLTNAACTTYPNSKVMEAVKMSAMSSLTCKDMMAMDEAGMMAAGTTIHMSMMDDAKVGAMADADVTKMAGDACTAHPDATVMDAMKM
ncbi:MAG: HdeA/HdeB family chaperone [bacterium]